MGITAKQIDKARDAAQLVLTNVTKCIIESASPDGRQTDVEDDWESSLRTWHMTMAFAFLQLRRSVVEALVAIPDEVIDHIILVAEPGRYTFLPQHYTASTAHAAAIALGMKAYGVLGAVKVDHGTVDLGEEHFVELMELLDAQPRGLQEEFWNEAAQAVLRLKVPEDWHTAIDYEWRAAQLALAAGRDPQAESPNGQAMGDGQMEVEPKETISDGEAEAVARKLAKKNPRFVLGTAEEWAAAIERESGKRCNPTLVKKRLPFWDEEMERQGRSRSKARGKGRAGSRSPGKAASLTSNLEATQKGRTADDPAQYLIAQEQAELIAKANRAIQQSCMTMEEKAELVKQLHDGEITAERATQIAEVQSGGPRLKSPI